MIIGLRDHGATAPVGSVMRQVQPLFAEEPLLQAFSRMRALGTSAEVVVNAQGRVAGVLTNENIVEMMMVENARPGFRFRRR